MHPHASLPRIGPSLKFVFAQVMPSLQGKFLGYQLPHVPCEVLLALGGAAVAAALLGAAWAIRCRSQLLCDGTALGFAAMVRGRQERKNRSFYGGTPKMVGRLK